MIKSLLSNFLILRFSSKPLSDLERWFGLEILILLPRPYGGFPYRSKQLSERESDVQVGVGVTLVHRRDTLRAQAQLKESLLPANILGELYSKLIINSSINSLGVITGATLGKLLAVRKIRSIFIALMREAMAVAEAMGIKVEATTGGRLDYCQFLAGSGPFQGFKRHLIIRVPFNEAVVTMVKEIEAGRRPRSMTNIKDKAFVAF